MSYVSWSLISHNLVHRGGDVWRAPFESEIASDHPRGNSDFLVKRQEDLKDLAVRNNFIGT